MITVEFTNQRVARVKTGWQYDKNQILQIKGLKNLPASPEVQYGVENGTETERTIGTYINGILTAPIPETMMAVLHWSAYVYVTNETSGTTVFEAKIELNPRPKPGENFTPSQLSFIDRLSAALNTQIDIVKGFKDGVGISAVNVIEGHLWVTLTNGVEIDTGNVRGDAFTYSDFTEEQLASLVGKSAYQTWLDLGNTGTEADFIASLQGLNGQDGIDGTNGELLISDIVNDLTTGGTTKPLSAEQGKVLNTSVAEHIADTVLHVTAEDKAAWDGSTKNLIGYGMKNYISQIGRMFEEFETLGDWTGGGNTTLSANTTEYMRGLQGLKVYARTAGTEASATKTISLFLGDTNRQFRFWVYCHDTITSIDEAVLMVTSTTDFSKFITASFKQQVIRQGWNYIVFNQSDWTHINADSWENKMLRFRIRIKPVAGQTLAMTFDAMDYDVKSEPRVVITFDDALSSVYTTAYPLMKAAGLKGVVYCNPINIGNAAYFTLAQLHELYDEGWDIGNHSWSHPNFATMTEEEILAEITTAQEWLVTNGFTRSAAHFAIPNGTYDADTIAAIEASDVVTVRSSNVANFYPSAYDLLYLPTQYYINTTTLLTAIGWLETAISKGQTTIHMLHGITETASTTYEWSTAKFTALIDYIKSRNIRIVTISEWYEGLNL